MSFFLTSILVFNSSANFQSTQTSYSLTTVSLLPFSRLSILRSSTFLLRRCLFPHTPFCHASSFRSYNEGISSYLSELRVLSSLTMWKLVHSNYISANIVCTRINIFLWYYMRFSYQRKVTFFIPHEHATLIYAN